jgi:hypothetical protein
VTPSATASAAAPVFASDEEALAAAQSRYELFIATIDKVVAEGGAQVERIDQVAVPELAEEEKVGVRDFTSKGFRMTGRSQVTNAVLQSRSTDGGVTSVITIYACVDVSQIEVVDQTGTSVVQSTRPDQSAFEVTLSVPNGNLSELLVVSNSVWNGGGVC